MIKGTVDKYIGESQVVATMEEYEALTDEQKQSYDNICVQMGTIAPKVLEHQVSFNKNLKWVHSISAGIDGYVAVKSFRDSPIPLTNAKGAYSEILGEFIALGTLYHSKHLERFMDRKAQKKWEIEPMEVVNMKHMVIVGYGDIGSACGKIAKHGLGMKVTGLKRRPDQVTQD